MDKVMIGNIIFILLILVEISLMVWGLIKKTNVKKERAYVKIPMFLMLIILSIISVIDWGFKWFCITLILGIQALLGGLFLYKKKDNKTVKSYKLVLTCFNRVFLIFFALVPVLIFPQYKPIKTTGNYPVTSKVYTVIDESRNEEFTEIKDDKRNITFECWYPANTSETFPLVIFSHGAFGYRMSNYSTYQDLASNGYVVCSIDHTYHAFMTQEASGSTKIVNMDFINNAMAASNGDITPEESYKLEQEWLKLRTDDFSFVFNYIKENKNKEVFSLIDFNHIGVMGHSLGGATAAQIGRLDDSIDAVIVIDGTMLGEKIGFDQGKDLISNEIYQKPILNIFSEEHYNGDYQLDNYPNKVVYQNAVDAYEVIVKDSGHMNFTDLPIVSPFLSGLLGKGSVDSRYCIEKTNEVILEFFNHYLKSETSNIDRVRNY